VAFADFPWDNSRRKRHVLNFPGATAMPNDAKLGLVCGVGLVIAVAIVYFRREAPLMAVPSGPAAIGKADNDSPPPPQRTQIPARPTGWTTDQSLQTILPEHQTGSEEETHFHSVGGSEGPPPIGLIPPSPAR
jgi:hypothetical protein